MRNESSQLQNWSSYDQVLYQTTNEAEDEEGQNANQEACNQHNQDQQRLEYLSFTLTDISEGIQREKWNAFKSIVYKVS